MFLVLMECQAADGRREEMRSKQAEKLKSREMKDVEECWRMMKDDGGQVEWLILRGGGVLWLTDWQTN